MTRRLSIFPIVAAILLALAVAAAAFSPWGTGADHAGPRLDLAAKRLRLAQSRANEALIKLPNAKPGQIARGTTQVSTSGVRARVSIAATNLRDVAGANGGRLIASRRLWIDVRCVATPCPASPVVYRGPLSDMGTRGAGLWLPGTHRTYSVRVWLLRGGMPPSTVAGDNRFQGSQAKFGLLWQATAL